MEERVEGKERGEMESMGGNRRNPGGDGIDGIDGRDGRWWRDSGKRARRRGSLPARRPPLRSLSAPHLPSVTSASPPPSLPSPPARPTQLHPILEVDGVGLGGHPWKHRGSERRKQEIEGLGPRYNNLAETSRCNNRISRPLFRRPALPTDPVFGWDLRR